MANKKTDTIVEETAVAEEVTAVAEDNTPKMVTIKLPKTRTEQDDVYVCVNGNSYQIKRGVAVEVPDFVAEVLEHRDEMLAVAMEFEQQAAENAQA